MRHFRKYFMLKKSKKEAFLFYLFLISLTKVNSYDSLANNNNYNNEIDESYQSDYRSECYDLATGVAKKCMPEFTNAAYGLKIIASNTCGVNQPTEYCLQSNLHNLYSSKNSNSFPLDQLPTSPNDFSSFYRNNPRCTFCDNNEKRHPAEYLNDYNNQGNLTWWQSETMLEGIQYPNSVNLTLNLGKSFEINYVQVKFYSPRPESFAIYKRTSEKSDWEPYQYYSASCEHTYNVPTNQIVKYENEAVALCTDEFSDIAPLTGASVVFGTLEDRPSAYNFDNSPELKQWVTATDIRITLTRLNTFGDEVFNDPQVLKSYYYAISGIAVGGRCKCNGHANRCVLEQQHDFEDRLKCECQHNTDGVDCNQCLPFFNDVPWEPATQLSAHECKKCDCNGLSKKCHFNQTLYDLTGHGGYCDDCEGNTTGPNCEECNLGYYRRQNENTCINCQCNPVGSESIQCNPDGKCRCRPGVVGEKCDRCAPFHYELSFTGCKQCSCSQVGSFDSPPICEPINGVCRCKANVEGKNCDRPKHGYFDLSDKHLYGALPCFCYGHSSQCESSNTYVNSIISAEFNNDLNPHRFKAIDSRGRKVEITYLPNRNGVSVDILNLSDETYFLVSEQFLGNQLYSYNQEFSFDMQILADQNQVINQNARPFRRDIILENSHEKLEVFLSIHGNSVTSNNQHSLPAFERQKFTFKLNQYSGWMPALTAFEFQRLLSNLSAIKIRASYIPMTKTLLSEFQMKSAKLSSSVSYNQAASYIETCKCPIGFTGQHCESCAYGYRREPPNGGLFASCVPCTCNNHSITCEANTGKCDCIHHTNGNNCEQCEPGYYGNPLLASINKILPATALVGIDPQHASFMTGSVSELDLTQMCKKCPCPNGGSCAEMYNYQLQINEVVCLECPLGTQGNLCELCDDGYYNSADNSLSSTVCERCVCSGNIDENAIGNCDTQTGTCLKCIYNTTGNNCQECLPDHWGNALTSMKCHLCDCFHSGTVNDKKSCNLDNGQCECKQNVKNRQCNECRDGYWNILSGDGCQDCGCNPLGSINLSCNSQNGQCFCRDGVTGVQCDMCKPNYFGFGILVDGGCQKCDCDIYGTDSDDFQCDDFGKCKCREGFAGLKCNKCHENRHNFTSGCPKCEDCYNLVHDKVESLREKLKLVEKSLNEMLFSSNNKEPTEFEAKEENIELIEKLKSLKLLVEDLHIKLFTKRKLKPGYKDSVAYLQGELKKITDNIKSTDQQFDQFNIIYKQAEKFFKQLNSSIYLAQTQLNFISLKNKEKNAQLESIKNDRIDYDHNIKLQVLAKQGREAAYQQSEVASDALIKYQKYLNDARHALKHLKEVIAQKERLNEENQANILEINYEKIKNNSDTLIKEAIAQKEILELTGQEAKNLIKKINDFKIPRENQSDSWISKTKEASEEIKNKYISMKNEIDELKVKIDQFSSVDSIRSINSAQAQLKNAKIKQKDIDYLFNIAENAKNQSFIANKLAEKIFENASKIFDTLKRFDQLILEGNEKMQRAVDLKPRIETNLAESEIFSNKVAKQLKSLNEQLVNFESEKSKSIFILQNMNSTLESLREKFNDLKNMIFKLNEKTNEINKSLNKAAMPKSTEAIEVFSNLNSRSDKIQKQVELVTNGTQKLLDNANNALENLNRANKSISDLSVSNLNRDDIEKLQEKFDLLTKQIEKNFNIDETILNLEKKSKLSLNIALQYDYEVNYLKQQVNDLEALNRTLRRECYNTNTIVIPEL